MLRRAFIVQVGLPLRVLVQRVMVSSPELEALGRRALGCFRVL